MKKPKPRPPDPTVLPAPEAEEVLAHRLFTIEARARTDADDLRHLADELALYRAEMAAYQAALQKAQAELAAARDRYQDLYDFAPVGYVTSEGDDDRIVEVNLTGAALLGVPRDELLGQSLRRFVAPADLPILVAHKNELLTTGQPANTQLTLLRAEGTPLYAQLDCIALINGPQQPIRSIITDISSLRLAERSLAASEERYRQLILHIPDVVWSLGADLTLTFVSPCIEGLVGESAATLIGSDMSRLLEWVHPADREHLQAATARLIEGGHKYDEVFRLRRKDGSLVWVRNHAMRGQDADGRLRIDGLLSDISEQRRAQEQVERFNDELARQLEEQRQRIERLERRRADMEKLAATGRLAAAVAHEINNPLAGIKSSLQLIKKTFPPEHPHYEFIALIDKELARVAEIIRQMYLLYQPPAQKQGHCHAEAALKDVLQILESTFKAQSLTPDLAVAPALPPLQIAEGEFKQVAYNIIHNAIQAAPAGSAVTIRVAPTGNGYLDFAVTDRGPGIPAEILPHIFEPFFTSHGEAGGSMGLGLSVTRSLVEGAGGRIEVDTRPGKGTTFHVTLPSAREPVAAGAPETP